MSRKVVSVLFFSLFLTSFVLAQQEDEIPALMLRNGFYMPQFGLGTYLATGTDVYKAVKEALRLGYRLIDTAHYYGNHKEIGRALKEVFDEGKIQREDVFITSKVWINQMSRRRTTQFIQDALRDLQLTYLDLVLIHFPERNYMECYRTLEEAVDNGTVRAIGLSNFNEEQCNDVWNNARIKPVNLQVQSDPRRRKDNLLRWCKERGVTFTAHSLMKNMLLNRVVRNIAAKYNKSPAQILIRYQIQRGAVAIPKTTRSHRLKENMDVFGFEISQSDMNLLNRA